MKNKYILIIVFLILFSLGSCKRNELKINNISLAEQSVTTGTKDEILNNLYIDVNYTNQERLLVKIEKESIIDGLDLLESSGEHKIKISYQNHLLEVLVCVEIPLKVEKIVLTDNSILTSYDSFPLDNLEIEITYSDLTKVVKEVSAEIVVEGLENLNKIGKHKLVIQVLETMLAVEIEVLEKPTPISIKLNGRTDIQFELGNIDFSALSIIVMYSDNSMRLVNITNNLLKNPEVLNEVGSHTLIIAYENIELEVAINIIKPFDYEAYKFEFNQVLNGYEIVSYNGSEEFLTIPSLYQDRDIVSIGKNAFYGNEAIKSVIIPSTIKSIGKGAFYFTNALNTIFIPQSVEQIGEYAFYINDENSKKIFYYEGNQIPETWSENWYDKQHSYIHLNVDVNTIKRFGLYEYFTKEGKLILSNYYGNETELVLPDKINEMPIHTIGGACFKSNNIIETLQLSNTIKVIEKYGISECINLNNLILSNTLEEIGECGIKGCRSLTYLELPTSLKLIGNNAFNHCSSLKELLIPNGVEKIDTYAFSWCVSMTKLVLPDSVSFMGNGACYACSSLTIYMSFSEVPSNWESGWNMSSRPIIFNYVNE